MRVSVRVVVGGLALALLAPVVSAAPPKGSAKPAASHGTLVVALSKAANIHTTVVVSGKGVNRRVTRTSSLKLRPGRYVVTARSWKTARGVWYPVRTRQVVSVVRAKRSRAAVDYAVYVPNTTRPLTGSAARSVRSVSARSLVMTARVGRTVRRGQILVSAPSPAAPNGFLRKVIAVQRRPNGTYRVTTRDATLPQAVPFGAITTSAGRVRAISTDPSSAAWTASGRPMRVQADLSGQVSRAMTAAGCSRTDVPVRATVDTDLGYTLTSVWSPSHRPDMRFALDTYGRYGWAVDGEITSTCSTAPIRSAQRRLAPTTVRLGPVPVVLTPSVGVDAQVRATATGRTSASAAYEHRQTMGVLTRRGAFLSPVDTARRGWGSPSVGATTAGALRISLTPTYRVLLYGATGVTADVPAYVETGVVPSSGASRLDGGASVTLAFRSPILGVASARRWTLLDQSQRLLPAPSTAGGGRGSGAGGGAGGSTPETPETPVPPLTGVRQVAAGGDHSCALRTDGQVLCWGDNVHGQLGDGTTTRRSTPAPVSGLTDAEQIASGDYHSCALRTNGGVVCWGRDDQGQRGDGDTAGQLTPTAVELPDDAEQISAGRDHACALLTDGEVFCWGKNLYGQVGDGTSMNNRAEPVQVPGLIATEISAGYEHTCARSGGDVVCWGRNNNGQLGNGTTTDQPTTTPTPVSGLTDATRISAGGDYSCAIHGTGQAMCWGLNDRGQLGDTTTISRPTPGPVSGVTDAIRISAGVYHACAARAGGQAVCWGRNDHGQVGDGSTTDTPVPAPVSGLPDATDVSAGGGQSCAVRRNGQAACWGLNASGQLGDGTTDNRWVPAPVLAP